MFARGHEWLRWGRERPGGRGGCMSWGGVCAPQLAVCACNNPDHPTWQRCGSYRGQSKSRFTLSKVNKTLTLIGRTRTLSDVMDGRDGCTNNLEGIVNKQAGLAPLNVNASNFETNSSKKLIKR
jgi:hypothetical protein